MIKYYDKYNIILILNIVDSIGCTFKTSWRKMGNGGNAKM